MEDIKEVICIGHYHNYAVYADEYNDLKLQDDHDKVINDGDICMNPDTLQSVKDVDEELQCEIAAKFSLV